MAINLENFRKIKAECDAANATLVAVSKIKPEQDILALREAGQLDFGENYVQELVEKADKLPKDIRWHFIGHLQRNKVKYIAPFVHLIHGVDSFRLLEEISKQADKLQRDIHCLLQVHIATEETKFGMDADELEECLKAVADARTEGKFTRIKIRGLMGMASFSDKQEQIEKEFEDLFFLYNRHQPNFDNTDTSPILSMGMSGDYQTALQKGSNMIRIGSALFGMRN
ncbi:MAG: YggS family pyridoxal phosphate-dependent enzyme [Chitinophagaceae bacterium]|nr:YggS family pyridoxal phosphate-dependent enzyme [Chitinophagaceae bacterium]